MAGRFFRRGISKILWLPAVAAPATPTSLEIAAGTSLDVQLADISGFEFRNSPIPTPDLASTFTTSIPGEDTAQDPSITFYDLDNAAVIRTALAKGTAGFVLLAPYGMAATKRCEVWPATSTGVNDVWTTGNESAKFMVGFAITAAPTQSAVLP